MNSHCGKKLETKVKNMSNLTAHAKKEMELAGLFNKDADYDGMIAEAVMELVECFAAQGHSGESAALTLRIFNTVASFKPLTPITSDPDEWMFVTTDLWQNRRSSTLFSHDGGQTYYDVDDPNLTVRPVISAPTTDETT